MSTDVQQNVLIVENINGDVYIVENKNDQESQVEKILKIDKFKPRTRRKATIIVETCDQSPIEETQDDDVIIEEYLEEYFDEDGAPPVFIGPDVSPPLSPVVIKKEFKVEKIEVDEGSYAIPSAMLDHQYTVPQQTFDGNFSSDENGESSENEFFAKDSIKKEDNGKPLKHKLRQLTGKPACKYCDTIFVSKDSLKMHICEYLQCDPKNFICRICNKELSKKTFSNHLHETLDCQYCGKKFVNPRNMKTHINKIHQNEEFIPPKSPNKELFQDLGVKDESIEPVLDEATGMLVTWSRPRKKYPRKKGRFECDLCGRIFTTVRSLKIHLDLHTNNHRYVCTTCGERYTTHTGISKHACLNKRRKRPEIDFRIFDVRHCKYCGLSFERYEDNKAHDCEFQFISDPKMFRCRFCSVDMSKNSYNKHMSRHLKPEKEWACSFCDKKLSDEIGLNIHLTTHTGDKPFKCPYDNCEQSFISKQLLTRHSRFHGAEIPIYSCKICGKEVASKYHLKNHMKIHSEMVECQLCKTEFETREALKEHYAVAHNPYLCSFCDKSFTLPRYLKMHEKLHKPSVKNFKCDYCLAEKSFTKPALLMNHIFKTHNDQFETWKLEHPEIFK